MFISSSHADMQSWFLWDLLLAAKFLGKKISTPLLSKDEKKKKLPRKLNANLVAWFLVFPASVSKLKAIAYHNCELVFCCEELLWNGILYKIERDGYVQELKLFQINIYRIYWKVKNFWHTNQHQHQYLIAFFLHSNCHSPNPHSCAFSIVTCDRKNEEKMRVGSTNISPNIGYSGRKEP